MSQIGNKFEALVEIVAKLRSVDGCPWDIEQTAESLLPYFIEEVYEVIEAIDEKNWDSVKEELGDVMLHLIFQALIANEKNKFEIEDTIEFVSKKLVQRHPHVFGDDKADGAFHAKKNWEEAKHKEKKRKSRIDGVPRTLPSIVQAQRIQQKASYAGFDWEDSDDVWKKISEEIDELRIAEKNRDKQQIENELGDVIFSVVNLARFLDISAENALRLTNKKFIKRFIYIENELEKTGKKFEDSSLAELDQIWNQAKGQE
ncbi:MAG: nucleoside triphosphate pyrophosphohydrolase [Candidatus Neomarinimicrobiota bacterium]|nr:nucleoside triphosphate pyrophosphohydrolase [Candidatus Neomarinimicrobiota bacterium]